MSETLLQWSAQALYPPVTSGYPQPDVRGTHTCWDFDADADEYLYAPGSMPYAWDGGDVTVRVFYAMSTAHDPALHVCWSVAWERVGDEVLDIDAESFAAAQVLADHIPDTCGHVGCASITFTNAQIDSVVAGEYFRLKILRDIDNGDDATGDAELIMVDLIQ